jgi:ubiquitin carboxyl-terminal hydrolase 7
MWLLFVALLSAPFSTALADHHQPAILSSGLRNLGNTCYMNAQLQCAFHIPRVRDIVLAQATTAAAENNGMVQHQHKEEDDETVSTAATTASSSDDSAVDLKVESSRVAGDSSKETARQPPSKKPPSEALSAMRELFQNMMLSGGRDHAYSPRSFCMRLGIPPMIQQDSQEFWKLLLPAMDAEELCRLYRGTYVDYITALDGSGREKRRDEVFLDLSLDVVLTGDTKHTDDDEQEDDLLRSLRRQFGKPELLSVKEGNGWRPAKGEDKVDAHKGSSLQATGLPPILQFHLKRFQYDWQTDVTKKLNDRFTFPQCLDLSEVCSDTKDNEAAKEMALYELQSVVVHVGEYGAGHYYAYVRPDTSNDQWYRFNDDMVELVTFTEVTDDVFGGCARQAEQKTRGGGQSRRGSVFQRVGRMLRGKGGSKSAFGWGGQTSNAYVVQYVRKKDIAFLYTSDWIDSMVL